MKNSSDTIGNRTRDLPTCSAVSQPTALRRAPVYIYKYTYTYIYIYVYISVIYQDRPNVIKSFNVYMCMCVVR